jgi:hypothetical protein
MINYLSKALWCQQKTKSYYFPYTFTLFSEGLYPGFGSAPRIPDKDYHQFLTLADPDPQHWALTPSTEPQDSLLSSNTLYWVPKPSTEPQHSTLYCAPTPSTCAPTPSTWDPTHPTWAPTPPTWAPTPSMYWAQTPSTEPQHLLLIPNTFYWAPTPSTEL